MGNPVYRPDQAAVSAAASVRAASRAAVAGRVGGLAVGGGVDVAGRAGKLGRGDLRVPVGAQGEAGQGGHPDPGGDQGLDGDDVVGREGDLRLEARLGAQLQQVAAAAVAARDPPGVAVRGQVAAGSGRR